MDSFQTSPPDRRRGAGARPPRWYRVLKWAAFYAACGALCLRIGQAVALQQEEQTHADIAAQKLERFRERKKQVEAELRALQTDQGLDKLFVENGFIRQGERVFAFPPELPPLEGEVSKHARAPQQKKPSVWERAADALERLWP